MTTAVLKNRLLDVTQGEFSERHWGVPTFRHFLSLFPETVEIDGSSRPALVVLLAGDTQGEGDEDGDSRESDLGPRHRVRPDLWRAVMDFSSGNRYVWDSNTGSAVTADGDDDRPTLPSLDRETYAAWRREFAEEQQNLVSEQQAVALERWRAAELGTSYIPGPIRGLWNAALKRHAIELLVNWFRDQGLEPPDNLVVTVRPPTRPAYVGTERLRAFVVECVGTMTPAELEALMLPAAAILRTRG